MDCWGRGGTSEVTESGEVFVSFLNLNYSWSGLTLCVLCLDDGKCME